MLASSRNKKGGVLLVLEITVHLLLFIIIYFPGLEYNQLHKVLFLVCKWEKDQQ